MKHECPKCGFVYQPDKIDTPELVFRPWHILHGRTGVRAYVESLGSELHEWLLALYVDEGLQLLAVDTVARGGVSGVDVPIWKLIDRGKALNAAGFILVHNHPSGDARPSTDDVRTTSKLARISRDLDVPLLDHLIIAGDQLREVGFW